MTCYFHPTTPAAGVMHVPGCDIFDLCDACVVETIAEDVYPVERTGSPDLEETT